MRYGKAERLIQLAIEMQAARTGLTITDIMERFSVSRRTAIRMRDAVLSAFPQADEVRLLDRRKRWRLPPASAQKLIGITADQLASLELASRVLDRLDLPYHAETVRALGGKIRALLPDAVYRQIEPDYEALVHAEVLAHQPRPIAGITSAVLDELRAAIKSCRKVRFDYATSNGEPSQERVVTPSGLIYGHRHYLAGWTEPGDQIKFFALGRIRNVAMTTESFQADKFVGLPDRLSTSFGVFDEAPQEVIWKFKPEAARVAKQFIFHPNQSLKEEPDGSLTVQFWAGGVLEMAWHIVKWGENVEVIAPERLRLLLNGIKPAWPALP